MTLLFSKSVGFRERLMAVFRRSAPDAEFWSGLEAALVGADTGVKITEELISAARRGRTTGEVKNILAEKMTGMLAVEKKVSGAKPKVILVLGVNGVGKTTTIAKLARSFQTDGKKVLLVAADTFRAAAVEQLDIWGNRLGVEVVSQGMGADPAAVAFDGVSKAVAKGHDIVLIDTAGRLHTKLNLMEELKKIARVAGKALAHAPHENLIVIDATVGSNGLAQAREFGGALPLSGAVLAKMDGTAKGGVVFGISKELKIPVTHIGTGEGIDDLKPFDPRAFVESILS